MPTKKPDIHRLLTLQRMLLAFRAIERILPIPPSIDKMENDVEHSYSLAMTAWFLASYFPHLDRDRLIRLALAHDLIEIHSGDTYAYHDNPELATKAERETAALEKLARDWPDWPEITEHIADYQSHSSEEAKFVYALDKLMPALMDYINEGRAWRHLGISFEDFMHEKEKKMPVSPDVYAYYQELLAILSKTPELFAAKH